MCFNKSRLFAENIISFTLVELLVVIAIISVLAAQLLPTLHSARDSAVQTNCLSQMRQIGTGIHLYSNDHNGYTPPPKGWAWCLLKDSYIITANSKKLYPDFYVYKPGALLMCPTISRPDACPPWRESSAVEWSDSNYKVPVTWNTWTEADQAYGWGYANNTFPRQRLELYLPQSVMLSEMWYYGNNTNHWNVTSNFYYYTTVQLASTATSQLLQHYVCSSNLVFADSSVQAKTFLPEVAIFNKNFTIKQNVSQ